MLLLQTLPLLAPVATGGGEDTKPGVALSALLDSVGDSMRVGGLLRAYYDNADDELSLTGDGISGLRLYDAQLWFTAELQGYEVFVKVDAGEATAFPPIDGDGVTGVDLRDAWVRKAL